MPVFQTRVPTLAPLFLVVAPLLAPLLAGCASDKYGPPPTAWRDTNEPAPTAAPPEVGAPAPAGTTARPTPSKRSAAEVAADKSDAATCMETAERLGGEQGISLVRECMHRGDFLDLGRAVREPWLPRMRTNAALQARVVEVIARRGGFLERDAPVLAKGKLPIRTLDDAIAAAKPGDLVIARGTVESVASEKWGTGTGLVAAVTETTWIDEDGVAIDGVPGIADVELTQATRTGRTFFVRVQKKDELKRAAEVVLLFTWEGPRKSVDADGEEASSAIGILVTAATASPTLRE